MSDVFYKDSAGIFKYSYFGGGRTRVYDKDLKVFHAKSVGI